MTPPSPLPYKIAFLGTGNMAEAMLKGLLRAGTATKQSIIATARRPERIEELRRTYEVEVTTDNIAAAKAADVVILSVKPQALNKLLTQIAPAIDNKKLIISVCAGVPIAAIERKLGQGSRIIRTMP